MTTVLAPSPSRASPAWTIAASAALLALAWWLSDVVLLTFAAVLLALLLRRAAVRVAARVHSSPRVALALVIVAVSLLAAGGTWYAGASAMQELQALRETVPRSLVALLRWLGEQPMGQWLLALGQQALELPDGWGARVGKWVSAALNAVVAAASALVLVVVLAVFLAADAPTYRQGLVRLAAPRLRPLAERTLDAVEHNLARWLVGQSISMLAVGVFTTIGLALLGVPMALTLGIITALLDFVPYIGAMSAGLLVVAVAFTEGEAAALQAALLCVAVQQAESFLVQPLVHRWAVRLPPALSLLAVVIFGLVFGLPGVLLAVPLMVVLMTLVQHLYVQAWLEDRPGTGLADGSKTEPSEPP